MHKFLEISSAKIGYTKPLISEVNASLDYGDVCLLIGNNGVGKTTLIKTILQQTPLLKGEISINNNLAKKLSNKEIAEAIAVVFSKAQIPNSYTTEDLISLGKFIHLPYYYQLGKEDKDEVENIISQLKLDEFKDVSLQKLSDGNLQKAYIGRALAQNSPMIILDEPTTHLDEDNKIIILKLLRNLAKKLNKIILFSSHDWRLAKEFADKIWFIYEGKLQEGLAEDVLLHNNLLTHPRLFTINENFVSPEIEAPFLEKEMLYSALQKNFEKDLSAFKIVFLNPYWEIKMDNSSISCRSVEEILQTITNSL